MRRDGLPWAASLWLLLTGAIAWRFHVQAPEPYMDEPFHVPQTQRYCRGDFAAWDPKITTFPGLYLAGAAWAHGLRASSELLAALLGTPPLPLEAACGTTALRSVNLAFGAACLALLYALHRRLHPDCSAGRSLGMAIVLSLFPLHLFFQFLYYTDVASVTAVIAAHLACLERRYLLAAVAAAAATGVRQTNAVWAAFTLGVAVMQECGMDGPQPGRHVLQHTAAVLRRTMLLRWQLLRRLWALAAVPAAFAAFAVINGGIVIGDKAAHAPVRHLAQPLYFLAFAAAALGPAAFSPSALRGMTRQLRRSPVSAAAAVPLATAAAAAVIDRGSVAHRYLLADNRHYTFYLWKDLLGRSAALRRCLAPLYLVAAAALWLRLRATQSALWCAAFAACTAAVLVPAALLEFRYFTVPFMLLALHMGPPTPRQLAVMGVAYAAVNAATIYVFLHRPYRWPDGSTARFMW